MCRGPDCLFWIFGFAAIFFTLVIGLSLRARAQHEKKMLKMTGDQAWAAMANGLQSLAQWAPSQPVFLNIDHLIYGIWTDHQWTVLKLTLRDGSDQHRGDAYFRTGTPGFEFDFDQKKYVVKPAHQIWGHHFNVTDEDGNLVATYQRFVFSRRAYVIRFKDAWELVAHRPGFNFRARLIYTLNGKVVGFSQSLSSTRDSGLGIALLPEASALIQAIALVVRGRPG